MTRHTLIIVLACLTLTACGSEQHSDLRKFVKDSDNIPRGRIEPLPEVKPYEPFEYAAFDLTDPFVARDIPAAKPPRPDLKDPRLDPNRRKGPLEAFPLENLKMVGTLQQKKDVYALIKTPDNNLYRVKNGNYMGQNFGVIAMIGDGSVTLKELIQDTNGSWSERTSTLQLLDEEDKK